MIREGCRYLKDFKTTKLCIKKNEKNPECKDCDVDPQADIVYNHSKFYRLARDTSPYGAELMLDFILEIVGGLDEKTRK